MQLSQQNIEKSFVSAVRTLLTSYFSAAGMQVSKQVFVKSPDVRVSNVVLPIVVVGVDAKLSIPAGLGQIGSGGRRQSKRTISINVGVIAKTSTQAKEIEERILNSFEQCIFLGVHSYTKDVQGVLIGNARVKPMKTDFMSDSDSPLTGSDLAIGVYHLSYYTDL